jgi:hypothetical protein
MSSPDTSHLDIDLLADLQEGLLEPEQVTAVAEHLDGCAECRARSLAIDDVRAALRAVSADAVVTAPEDVVRRLDDALAAAATPSATAAAAPLTTASATVTPLTASTNQVRQPWKTRVLQAAAVFVLLAVVVAIGFGGIHGIGGGGSKGATSASGGGNAAREKSEAHAGRYSITSSGRDYTATSLRAAVPGLLSHAAGDSVAAGADVPSPTSSTSNPSPTSSATKKAEAPAAAAVDPQRLRNGTALAQCVANLAGGPVTPLAVDFGRFEGKPATIIVLPDPVDASRVYAYAVAPDCPTGLFLASIPVTLP